MADKTTLHDCQNRIKELEKEAAKHRQTEKALSDCKKKLHEANQELEEMEGNFEKVFERTNRMAVEAEIATIEIDQVFNASADGMWVIDAQFTVKRINPVLLHVLGESSDAVLGRKCYELFRTGLCRTPECPMSQFKQSVNRLEFDIEKTDEDGNTSFFILTASPLRDPEEEVIGIVEGFKNITKRRGAEVALAKANQELKLIAGLDGLTQIANRRRFDECMNQEWRRMARERTLLSLIMCDIDFFKLYNDHYGHLMGDDCLRSIAQVISSNIKRPGDLVARYGGEEFVVILPNTPAEGAVHVAETIRKALRNENVPHARSSVTHYVTLSMGVSGVIPSLELPPQILIGAADKALYEAKAGGRNRVVLKTATM